MLKKNLKKIYLVAALLAAGVYSPAHAGIDNIDRFNEEVLSSIVSLNSSCTGSIIYSDETVVHYPVKADKPVLNTYVLTAKHCVDSDSRDKIQKIRVPTMEKGKKVGWTEYYGRVINKDFESDLALIRLDDHSTKFYSTISLAEEDYTPVIGQTVFTVGFPVKPDMVVTEGLFSGRIEIEDYPIFEGKTFFQQTPNVYYGNSGGVTVTKIGDEYKQIGVLSMMIPAANHLNFAVPIDNIISFLKKTELNVMFEEDTVE